MTIHSLPIFEVILPLSKRYLEGSSFHSSSLKGLLVMFRAVAYTVAGSCIILCLIDPELNIDLGRSSLSLRITRFLSILILVPLVDMGLNSYSLCSSLWAWHCIQVGAIMDVFLIFDSFLFS